MESRQSLMDQELSSLDIPVERDIFLRKLIRELSGSLENVVGIEEASGFISIVGQRIGDWMNDEYQKACQSSQLTVSQLPWVLIDLKKRIQGDFYLISQDDEKFVLGNRRCPFGELVKERPSMCMMTSNVFGTITAENIGYSKVNVCESIACGSNECRVVVYTKQCDAADDDSGREYFQS